MSRSHLFSLHYTPKSSLAILGWQIILVTQSLYITCQIFLGWLYHKLKNLVTGCRLLGIFPFFQDIFSSKVFLSWYSTDRPLEMTHKPDHHSTTLNSQPRSHETLRADQASNSPAYCPNHKSPVDLKSLPKADIRNETSAKEKRIFWLIVQKWKFWNNMKLFDSLIIFKTTCLAIDIRERTTKQ